MYKRSLPLPSDTFFLFGPRSTGKTTWLRTVLPNALWIDLLDETTYLSILSDPGAARRLIEVSPDDGWIVIDEVQRHPPILNEVHHQISLLTNTRKFALTGSSARQLRRKGVNLLAGRAIQRKFFPLTHEEMDFIPTAADLMKLGSLPRVRDKPDLSIDILESYVQTYLTEEIRQEAVVNDLASFSRFLTVAGIMNGQMVNLSGISRDAAVARTTVERYYDVLIDTLIGFWLPAWRPRSKVKEASHPKFYLFDCGVVRSITGRLRTTMTSEESGALYETLVLHELRAYQMIANIGGSLSYWRTPSGAEVDFLWTLGDKRIAIEVKASTKFKPELIHGLRTLKRENLVEKGFVVYGGDKVLREGTFDILPFKEFTQRLHAGQILGPEST